MIGIDTRQDVIQTSRERAQRLGLEEDISFQATSLREAQLPERLHAVMALHACDTATDDALTLGIRQKADLLAVAPCCQAELAQHFKKQAEEHRPSPLSVILHSPNLRRDAAATFTDALRLALIRALGYETTATEFIPSAHTPKNRLILGERRGRYNRDGWREFLALKENLGNPVLSLEQSLQTEIAERFSES